MKLRNHQFSIRPQIFEDGGYEHPWYQHTSKSPIMEWKDERDRLIKPNPPSIEAVKRAKFVDKTYRWTGSDSVRPRDKRTTA